MRVALVTVYSHDRCTLKDVAGGYGTVFAIGSSLPARVLERAKSRLARLPSPVLGYLAAQLGASGHELIVADVRRGDAGHDPLPECDVALVLSSLVDSPAELHVLRELSDAGARTVVFGAYATARPEAYAEVADCVVTGEPEALGAALLDDALRGVVDAGWVSDLDALPHPDWSAFPVARYRYAMLTHRGPTLPVSGVRGCAFGCGYCPFRVTAPFRQREPSRVVAEVRHLVERYGARAIAFRDPLFNLDRDRVRAIASGIRPLGVRFSAEMRADRLDEPLLRELRDAGLRSLEIGVESLDRAMLARERRSPPTQAQIERVVAAAHRLGVRVIANFILGLPDDDEPTIRATVAWAKQLNPFAVQFTVATPYPGTTLEARVRHQLTDLRPDRYTGWQPVFDHPRLPAERLTALREWAYVSYHARPRYVARFLRHAAGSLLD